MTAIAKFRQVETDFGGAPRDIGEIEVVLSHIEAIKPYEAGATLVLLQGGNGVYVRESPAEVRAVLDAAEKAALDAMCRRGP